MLEGEVVDRVGAPAWVQDEARQHRIEGYSGELYPRSTKDLPVVLDVVTRLGHRGIGEYRSN